MQPTQCVSCVDIHKSHVGRPSGHNTNTYLEQVATTHMSRPNIATIDTRLMAQHGLANNGTPYSMSSHTKVATNWGDVKVGDRINLEIDTLARYVARLQEWGT